MEMLNLATNMLLDQAKWNGTDPIFALCTPEELTGLQPRFGFDQSTLVECQNYDENVRFNSYGGYDFISFVYFWQEKGAVRQVEINLFIGERYLLLVAPKATAKPEKNGRLAEILDYIRHRARELPAGDDALNKLYYLIFDRFLVDFSETLEALEDHINAVEGQLEGKLNRAALHDIAHIKENLYRIKRHARPMLYIGDQMLVNENGLIRRANLRLFQSLDQRLNKLYDFVANLQEYVVQLLNAYDAKISMQTNEIVNKLTILSVIVGPLTVITGIYGMNFTHMPELTWRYGYWVALAVMALISGGILWVLKRKKWL